METDRYKLLKYKRTLEKYNQNEAVEEREVTKAIEGLLSLLKHSEQDDILDEVVQTFCNFFFHSSFFTEDIKELFMRTLHEEAQRYGWDLNKNMVN